MPFPPFGLAAVLAGQLSDVSGGPQLAPIISRLNSLSNPVELKPGMVFALETYWPATDGRSAARIEEELVVTEDGSELLTLFPAEELVIANRY